MALLYEVSDHIATITINRPDALNSIDLETWRELSEAGTKLEAMRLMERRLSASLALSPLPLVW